MKTTSVLSALCFAALLCSSLAWAADATPAGDQPAVRGKVLEAKDVGGYTYLRLQTKDGETWAAVNKTAVTTGDQVTIEGAMVMENFESKALQKTFDRIVFGVLHGGSAAAAAGGVAAEVGDIKVDKASGPDARTVAEIVTKSADLKDRTIVVRGKVVRYNAAVMGKNWVHLRDGSGSASDKSNDLLVTTKDTAKLGDVVTVKGVVRTDKDFGSGYSYKVLVEDGTLQK